MAKKTTKKKAAATHKKLPQAISKQILTVEEELRERWEDLCEERHLAETVLEKYLAQILKNPDVTGVGVDFKMKDGQYVRPLTYSIRITVAVKRHKADKLISAKLKTKLGGVPIDVVQRVYKFATCSSTESSTFRNNPNGGTAIARAGAEHDWGTMGMRVRFGSAFMYLTNEHVSGPVGTEIRQPPFPVPLLPPSQLQIGFVQRTGGAGNRSVDCAIIRAANGSRQPGLGILGPGDVGLSGTYATLRLTDAHVHNSEFQVFAIGGCSGHDQFRLATITNIAETVQFQGGPLLVQQITAKSVDGARVVSGGDSGSALIIRSGTGSAAVNSIVGLVVAEFDDGKGIVANHIDSVFDSLNIGLAVT